MDQIKQAALVSNLNSDLESEFQSIVQYVHHISLIKGAEFVSIVDELKVHLSQELAHACTLAEQISFLGGQPSVTVPVVAVLSEAHEALRADLALEECQLDRYRSRVQEAADAGLPDVAEALRPLLTQTQEHVRDLQAVLGDETGG